MCHSVTLSRIPFPTSAVTWHFYCDALVNPHSFPCVIWWHCRHFNIPKHIASFLNQNFSYLFILDKKEETFTHIEQTFYENETPGREPETIVAACIGPQTSRVDSGAQILENILLHRIFGITDFNVYDAGLTTNFIETLAKVDDLATTVKILPWNLHSGIIGEPAKRILVQVTFQAMNVATLILFLFTTDTFESSRMWWLGTYKLFSSESRIVLRMLRAQAKKQSNFFQELYILRSFLEKLFYLEIDMILNI